MGQAREVAAEQGAIAVGTQHLLLALLRLPDSAVTEVLRLGGVDYPAVLATLEAIIGIGYRRVPRPVERLHVSCRARAVLDDAAGRAPAGGGITDRAVLTALVHGDEFSLARLIVRYLGVRGRVLTALEQHAGTDSRPEHR
jgi:ATP-dependent Clp protease ATP-binding subunit ClpA